MIGGFTDGTFRPRTTINRAEFLKILVGGLSSEELHGETGCFRDVSREWFAQYVCAAKRLGWIDGYSDGTFKPSRTINRAEAMKILTIALRVERAQLSTQLWDVFADSWFAPYVARGVAIGIVKPSGPFFPDSGLTRGDAAIWIDRATKE